MTGASVATFEPAGAAACERRRSPRGVWIAYGALGAMLLAYFAFLLLRDSHAYSPLMDGWVVVGLEASGGVLCLARGLRRPRRGRTVPLVLGAAMMSWSIGDLVLTLESLGGATPPTPSLADAFYLGFFPLAYLSSLAVGELKLDRTFIASLATGDHDRDLRLVRSTIELGHALDMRVVAEGIEDQDTLKLLSELGCDVVQGYFIGRPEPADRLAFGPEPGPLRELVPPALPADVAAEVGVVSARCTPAVS